MPISAELTRMAQNVGALNADTNAIFEALRAKGVPVPANAQLSDVADMIESIVPPHQNEVEIGGRWYPYVQIGNQLWLAENLSVDAGTWIEYPNEPERGKYYFDNTIASPFRAITLLLPDGWRIPSSQDFQTLIDFCSTDSGTKLKSTEGWINGGNGTDEFGFNAKPCQRYAIDPSGSSTHWGDYTYGSMARFWTSDTAYYSEGSYVRKMLTMSYSSSTASISIQFIDNFYLNIRLVKDLT